MASNPGNVIVAPDLHLGDTYTPAELMYSMQGYTQKGRTLKSGQGTLPVGTILIHGTSGDAGLVLKAPDAAGLTQANFAGILRLAVDTSSPNTPPAKLANIVLGGYVKASVVRGNGTTPNATAVTDKLVTLAGVREDTNLGFIHF